MNVNEASRILVLDPIHGAEVIAEELKGLGKDVEIFNPYRNPFLDQTFLKGLSFDLVIAPVHLNPNFEIVKHALKNNIPFMTHHEAVKEIVGIKNLFTDIKVVEVTGTIGKTTVCELISQLLKNKKVLSHTSSSTRFVSLEDTVIFQKLGGAPANVLKVMEIAREKILKPDIALFEISLGLTGIGDVGVITSLKEDYRIAGGTKDASAAKKASIKNFDDRSIIVHQGLSDVNMSGNTFGDKDKTLWIKENKVIFNQLGTINGDFMSGEIAFKPLDSYIGTAFYRDPLEAAFCAVLSLGIPPKEINTTISAVGGRMKLEELKGRFLIDNSNSGTRLKFIGEMTEMARRLSEKMILIVGEESEYVCEGVSMEELQKVVAQRASDFVEILIVGEKFKGQIRGKNVLFAPNLEVALENAINDSKEGSVIVSNVKMWR